MGTVKGDDVFINLTQLLDVEARSPELGDVLQYRSESDGWGVVSGVVRLVDLGVVDIPDALIAGVGIYVPSFDEVVMTLLYATDGAEVLNGDFDIEFTNGTDVFGTLVAPSTKTATALIAATPIIVHAVDLPYGAIGTWAANTDYALDDMVLDSNGHVQVVTDAGNSGDEEPTWNALGGTTVDDGVVWTDNGVAPTTGKLHIYAQIATAASA